MKLLRMFAATLVAGLISGSASADVINQYNLGEDDGFLAIAGFPGTDPTIDAVGSNDLIRLGDTLYSSDTPGGSSTLSMQFDGSGDYYYGAAPSTDVTRDFTYSFDAKMNAGGANGFSFLASMGSNFGGISVVEIGGTVTVFFPGAGNGSGGFQPTAGVWHNYVVDYAYNGGAGAQVTTLTVDGNLVSTRNGGTANNQIVDALTLGGNFREPTAALSAARTASNFEGSFNGLIDNFVFDQAPVVPEPSTLAVLGLGSALGLLVVRRKAA